MSPKLPGFLLIEAILCVLIVGILMPIIWVWGGRVLSFFSEIRQDIHCQQEWLFITTHLQSELAYSHINSLSDTRIEGSLEDGTSFEITYSPPALKLKRGAASAYTLNTELVITTCHWSWLAPRTLWLQIGTSMGSKSLMIPCL